MALPHPPPHPALRDNGDRGGVRGRDGMGRDGMGRCRAVPLRAAPAAAFPAPVRPGRGGRGCSVLPPGGTERLPAGGMEGWMPPGAALPLAAGRSGGRRCVPALPAEPPGMWEPGRAGAAGRGVPGPSGRSCQSPCPPRASLAALQVSFIAPGRGGGGTALCGAAGAELSDGGLQVQLSKRVIQSTKGWVCSRSVQLDAGYLKWVFLTRLLKG